MPLNLCGLQAAEANRAVLRYIAEDPACWGVTPADGRTREMRITSSSLTANKETVVSNELRADRMIPDVIEVARSSGGEINFEFSAGSLDDFMQAFLLGTWSRTMTFDKFEGTAVSIQDAGGATHLKINGDFARYFEVGQRVKTEGFVTPANNDYWEVLTVDYNITNTGVTTLITTVDTGATEAANAFGRIMDANDVIVLKSTAIRAGTSALNTFDSNGGNAFSAAISAGELKLGQKIYVSGLGYEAGSVIVAGTKESGSIVLSDTPAEEDAFSINDGTTLVTFELDDGPDGVTGGRTAIDITGLTTDQIGAEMATVINASALNVTATYDGGTNTLTIVNDNTVLSGAQLTASAIIEVTDAGSDMAITDFSGYVAGPADGDTLVIHDGEKSVTFEFDNDGSFARGSVGVTLGATGAATAANLQAAIMDQLRKKKFQVSASVSSATVTIRNLHPDQAANAATSGITEDPSSSALTTTDFTGGTASFGFFTITGLTADVITVAETVATNANGTSRPVTIKGSHVRNPGDLEDIIAQSFSIETGYTDKGLYFLQNGMRVGGFGLTVNSGEIMSGTLNLMGKETLPDDESVLGDTAAYDVLASTATPIFNATVNVGNIYKNGELLATALQAIELTGEAALREQRAVGSTFPAGIGTGRFNLTGKLTSYFETLEMYDHFLNHDTVSLAFDLKDGDKNAYWFTIPALKITTDPIAPGGIDQDVLEELEFVALRDPNLNTQFMVDRFSSTLPATS